MSFDPISVFENKFNCHDPDILMLNGIFAEYYPGLVNRVAIVTQYTLQSLRPSGCSGASRRGAAEYWAWDRRVAGRRRGCWWREGGVPRCSGTPTPAHVSSIPPTRVLSCNPFRSCPPLRDPQTRIYITRLSQTGPWPSSLYRDRSVEEACH